MSSIKEIAAIILNYNAGEMTFSCVNKLLDTADELTIVVVDNNSSDGSGIFLEESFKNSSNVTVIKNTKNAGYAAGNNIGFRYLSENLPKIKYALVMNPDVEVGNAETIMTMSDALAADTDASVVTVKMLYNGQCRGYSDCCWKFPGKKELFWAGTFTQKVFIKRVNNDYIDNELGRTVNKVDVVTGCFFMTKLSDVCEVGYLDESTFLYFEETILAKKLEKTGKHELYLKDVQAFHNHIVKDQNLKNYKKRLMDRKFFHESKIYYINNYSKLTGIMLVTCRAINNLDFLLKRIVYGILSLLKDKVGN